MRADDLRCLFSSSQAYEEAQKKHKMAEEDQRKMVRNFLYMHNNVLMLIRNVCKHVNPIAITLVIQHFSF